MIESSLRHCRRLPAYASASVCPYFYEWQKTCSIARGSGDGWNSEHLTSSVRDVGIHRRNIQTLFGAMENVRGVSRVAVCFVHIRRLEKPYQARVLHVVRLHLRKLWLCEDEPEITIHIAQKQGEANEFAAPLIVYRCSMTATSTLRVIVGHVKSCQ